MSISKKIPAQIVGEGNGRQAEMEKFKIQAKAAGEQHLWLMTDNKEVAKKYAEEPLLFKRDGYPALSASALAKARKAAQRISDPSQLSEALANIQRIIETAKSGKE